ncbi:hydroxymethylbilane synthase [Dictyobacter aurantiacus]|uniref:Porphobilinogen deaminase n=1 Tax=Dictyobacter aurantiacus TaxID=1936993 RepID=A0A401Z7P0_9CHLR|nr:hydroxymethylbilane synthase [Dictyobacter aurantiacus]GCE02864.1 porphobilinogen deaminase [Dictyobacter aurantiacus]
MRVTIGTRASKLAMTQTQWIVQRLRQQWPNLDVVIEQIHTTGDRVTSVPLSQIGSDGVFVTEIEHALHEGRIDLAVHSLKDLPTVQPDDLRLVIVGPREDVRDVFVSRVPFQISEGRLGPVEESADLSDALRIGTCSLRRTAQIRDLAPHAQILSLRGNVDTRLRKLDAGDYDGIVLASAGLHRLGMQERLAERLTYFPVENLLPAPGQGALALECRADDRMLELLAPLQDEQVLATTTAERMFMRRLGAGCYLPVAAYSTIKAQILEIAGIVASLDGLRRIRVRQSISWTEHSTIAEAEQLGIALAEQALAQGAREIIRELALPRDREHLNV